jgi:hypothetical protein
MRSASVATTAYDAHPQQRAGAPHLDEKFMVRAARRPDVGSSLGSNTTRPRRHRYASPAIALWPLLTSQAERGA